MIRALIFSLWIIFTALPAGAHEVRPAYLELTERSAGLYDAVWKEPIIGGRRLTLDPVFPDNCDIRPSAPNQQVEATQIRYFEVSCLLDQGKLAIAGLERTLTDVFVRLVPLDGETRSALLTPRAPAWDLAEAPSSPVLAYLWIGVEHIWFGPDHLLFVLGLVLLVPVRRLFWVVTSFTLAHSITLGATALGAVSLPGRPVEILIAFSIALLAVEVMRVRGGEPSLAGRQPWAISFVIGLVHGFGFAGALAEIGLPRGAELSALLLFNLGVEAGQMAFVGAILVLGWALKQISAGLQRAAFPVLAYGLGITGVFWTLERVLIY